MIFTNYQFYVDGFVEKSRKMIAAGEGGYTSFVEPGNVVTLAGESEPSSGQAPQRLPQMPAYHLTLPGHGRADHGQHRHRPVQRQDHHRPYRGAAPRMRG